MIQESDEAGRSWFWTGMGMPHPFGETRRKAERMGVTRYVDMLGREFRHSGRAQAVFHLFDEVIHQMARLCCFWHRVEGDRAKKTLEGRLKEECQMDLLVFVVGSGNWYFFLCLSKSNTIQEAQNPLVALLAFPTCSGLSGQTVSGSC